MFNLARMTGYWDPEFKPSIEEIVHGLSMICGDSLSLLSLVSSYSGEIPLFCLVYSTWQVEVTSGSTRAPQ